MQKRSSITIYHHPHCSKSRETLAITQAFAAQEGLILQVVDYQKTPLTPAQLTVLHLQLGCSVRDMMRENEEEYTALNLATANDAALLRAIATHPKLLQRPIVSYGKRAAIGRPIEQVSSLLQSARK